tara:strand:- start:370 stop:579 length:210 start_codon:yes stop_codon:yes gene_type:complete
MRLLIFLFFFLISCGGGSDNALIEDNSIDIDENSEQDSIRINKSISISGEEDNIANVFGECVFGGCKFE